MPDGAGQRTGAVAVTGRHRLAGASTHTGTVAVTGARLLAGASGQISSGGLARTGEGRPGAIAGTHAQAGTGRRL
jgi:hypothetical protein